MKVILASNNKHKLIEIRDILGKYGYDVVLQSECGIKIDVEETGTTFAENSYLKAKAVFDISGLPTIADDSGLSVDALDGAPGIFSARYGAPECITDKDRTAFLLKNMASVPDGNRTAKFVCCITMLRPGKEPIIAEGECKGVITHTPSGAAGFGYDPVFYVPEEQCTFAEMGEDRKNLISHRANALRRFCEIIDGEMK